MQGSDPGSRAGEVRFCRPDETPYGPLSNYYPCVVRLGGFDYPSAEHAFQCLKAARKEVSKWLAAAPDAFLVAAAGDSLPDHQIIPRWLKRREELMRPVLWAKFTQHGHLRQLLISTGSDEIVECASSDNEVNRFWSKFDGVGANVLGRLLMELRADLTDNVSGSAWHASLSADEFP